MGQKRASRVLAALCGVAALVVAGAGSAVAETPNGATAAFKAALEVAGEAGSRECVACPVMVAIPAGSFAMGSLPSEAGHDRDEGPRRRVTIAAFAIGKYEATFDEWDACARDGYCASRPTPSDYGWGRGDRPVVNVSWDDITSARGFIAWLNSKTPGAPYRLPTEAEWEYAARAGAETRYSFGDSEGELGLHGWYAANSGEQTQPVGRKRANRWGVHDMHGNVWEWVEDCWVDSYVGAPIDGSARTFKTCFRSVLRGGAWVYTPTYLRSAYRFTNPRDSRSSFFGFRVARTLGAQ